MIGSGYNIPETPAGPRVRIYELAKELALGHREMVAKVRSLGIEVANHMSHLEPGDVDRVRRAVTRERKESTVYAAEDLTTSAPVTLEISHPPEPLSELQLAGFPRDGTLLVQEFVPGEEYSVDVLASRDGRIAAAVPRARLKVDSGIAVAARTSKKK